MTEPEAGQPDPDTAPEPAARADAGGSSRRPTESTVRTALLIVLCLLAVLVLRQGRLSATTSGNWDAMSAAILQTVAASEGAVDVSGGYLAGVGMVVHAELSGLSRADVSSWLVRTLSPVSSRIATIPDDEGLVIHIVVTGEGGYQQLVRIRSGDLTDPNRWTQSTDPLPGPPAASAPPAAQPTASASASPSATGTVSASPSVTASASASPSATGTVSAAGTAKGALTDDFSAGAAKWTTLTGTWEVADGVYRQTDASGYDFITQFTGEVPAACTVTVKIRPAGDKLGAGLLLGQPRPGTRSGATLVDVTDGSYLRWGAYSSGGTYQFTGGNALPGKAVKGQWHVLRVEVSPSRTVLFWDDRNVGEIKPIGKGRVGLVTSVSAVDFDDFSVTPA